MAERIEPHDDMAGLGARIMLLRKSKKWSQHELAERSGVSQGAISFYERDKSPGLPLAHAMRLADALGVPLQLLAYGKTVEKSQRS